MAKRRRDPGPGVRRRFLGWNGPVLPRAVDALIEQFRTDDALEMQGVIVVVPGQRAGRRLRELLLDAAVAKRLRYAPPRVVTEGQFPELLYVQRQPLAPRLVQLLAWTAAVRQLDAPARAALVPHPPADDEHLRWFRLGEMLHRVDEELAADGHDIADVVKIAAELPGFADHARWEVLRQARTAYHACLHDAGFWDQHAARLRAVTQREIATPHAIVLLATVDLNAIIVRMLAQLARQVTALIAAPESEAHRFDDFGRLVPAAWAQVEVPIRDEQIHFVEGPTEQAAVAAAWLSELGDTVTVEEVVLGVPEPGVVPALRRRLTRDGVTIRWVEATTLADTAPYRLLAAAAEYLHGRRAEAFAALVRHPDLDAWLTAEQTPIDLTALDTLQAARLPARIDGALVEDEALRSAIASVERWLGGAVGPRPLAAWAVVFAQLLQTIYGSRSGLNLDAEPDRTLFRAVQRLVKALAALREIPATLDLPLEAAEAFAVAFAAAAREPVPPQLDPHAVELLGWLELPLDDSRAALVLSFNDGLVPSAAGADAFLPDALRARLGIEHDARRYARDAYAATVLANSREQFACVVARRDADQNPLSPSRLLFTGSDATLCARARRWAQGSEPVWLDEAPAPATDSPFRRPPVRKRNTKRDSFRVSELRDYLACPYRYYLRYVEELKTIDDTAQELDGGTFGTLIHEVLSAWGRDANWNARTDTKALAEHLVHRLRLLAPRFPASRPAVRLQLLQAERRLAAFARAQVERIREGWRIVAVELDAAGRFDTDDGPVTLRGRIDRIDYHAESNTVCLLDYKTSDTALTPEEAHVKNAAWIDLQLPLYRHLWRDAIRVKVVPKTATVQLAYFQIPRASRDVGVAVASWTADDLAGADASARFAIMGIRNEAFETMTEPPPRQFPEFAALCLEKQQRPALDADEEGGDA